MSETASPARPYPFRYRAFVIGIALGVGLGLLALLAGLVLYLRDPLPVIDRASLEAAIGRWEEHGPENYRLTVETRGNQTSTYRVRVAGGQPVELSRGAGRPPPQRTWDYWTVPGLFDMIDVELTAAEQAAEQPGSPRVIVRAEFDPELGYPRRFRRTALGDATTIGWEVTEFQQQ